MAGLEELTGIDRRTIKQRIRTLTPEKGTKNAHIFWTGEALPLIYGRGEDETYDTDAERARLIHHQANIAALDEQVKEKTLIPAEVVASEWQHIFGNIRARLLSIPTTLAASCAHATREQVQEKAQELIKQALEELVEVVEY